MSKLKSTNIPWCPVISNKWNIERVKNKFYISKVKANIKNPTVLKLARIGVQIRDISNNEGQLAASYENYNPVRYGDLLLNPMDLYSGANCNMSEVEGVISPAYINLRTIYNDNPKYYDYYFKFQYWIMAMFAHGKGVSFDNRWTINTESILNYEIPVPSKEEQDKIVYIINKKCNQIDLLIKNQEKQIENLKAYKQSLITEVVTKGLDPNVEMKDSGVEWLNEIPKNWSTCPLKYFFDFGKGLPITKADLKENGEKVISYGQIHSKQNNFTQVSSELLRFVDPIFIETNPQSLVNKYDFIFADTSEDREGAGNFVYVNNNERIFAGYHTIILKNNTGIDYKYLAYLFMTDNWRSQIRCRVNGVKLFSITKGILSKTTIILPTLFEQNMINNFLDEKCTQIDHLITIKQNKIKKLNDYKKSIIYEYVTGKKEVI
ncbi:hypothetical protein B5F09_12065 [Erysipelatoclostridium sp. An173]|uniref:restriction endonuclease subunit S n=1 Tax=Erysipelatoclostridium sp. An173 TaxID=1965571 RepID=UPI000B375807|nr:restriction endonuclease subunit S [Erysipelatoclostridium sp. An173]OUP72994.1 hypothetical protein B5F09_12065 [Erysipelatoclostridium sp. An173]